MKLLFAHGLASSGAYKTADTLRILFKEAEVLSPDLPFPPDQALELLQILCREQQVDVVVGLSLGALLSQKLWGVRKVLINPDFHASRLLRTRIGTNRYLSPRADGTETFEITSALCDAYEALEEGQFAQLPSQEKALTIGLFATNDEVVKSGYPEFSLYYPQAVRYPGKHLPIFPEIKTYVKPAIEKLLTL